MDGQFFQDRIGSQLSGLTSGNTEGTLTTGTFAYDEDSLRDLITNWQTLGDSYDDSIARSSAMLSLGPPAEDFASLSQASAAGDSGKAYFTYLQHNRDYCRQQGDLFQQALDSYLGVEHKNVTEINKSGPQPGI